MFGFIPKEGKFFDIFKELGKQLEAGATEFHELVKNPQNLEMQYRNIKEIEHRGDELTHQTMDLLHKTFITPMDRNDIHALVSAMDDVLDFIDAASARMAIYRVDNPPAEAAQLSEIILKSVQLLKSAVDQLDNLKKPERILRACVEINRLENEADFILRGGLQKLFDDEQDLRRLIKLKEIYELLEKVTDRCEDVANIMEGIVLEYA